MAIRWRLKTYLSSNHQIFTATQLQRKLIETVGVEISLQNLCNLINKKPASVRLKTMEIICSSLQCELSDFCEIVPKKMDPSSKKKLSPQNTPMKARLKNGFPDPRIYDS